MFVHFWEALINAVVFSVQGISERTLRAVFSDDRPQLTGGCAESDSSCGWHVTSSFLILATSGNGLQPTRDGLQPNIIAMASNLVASCY